MIIYYISLISFKAIALKYFEVIGISIQSRDEVDEGQGRPALRRVVHLATRSAFTRSAHKAVTVLVQLCKVREIHRLKGKKVKCEEPIE